MDGRADSLNDYSAQLHVVQLYSTGTKCWDMSALFQNFPLNSAPPNTVADGDIDTKY